MLMLSTNIWEMGEARDKHQGGSGCWRWVPEMRIKAAACEFPESFMTQD